MNLQEKNVLEWIIDNGYMMNTNNIKELMKYIDDMEYIRTRDEVIQANIEYYDINCPIEYLDTDEIINNDNDYIYFKNETYLNVNWLLNDIENQQLPFIHRQDDFISLDVNVSCIGEDLIETAIENEWCSIEEEDIVDLYITPNVDDIVIQVLNYVDDKIYFNDNGEIERK